MISGVKSTISSLLSMRFTLAVGRFTLAFDDFKREIVLGNDFASFEKSA